MSNKQVLGIAIICASSLAYSQTLPMPPAGATQSPAPIIPTPSASMGVMTVSPTPLKYRDASKPLTIGEMADMAANKAQVEFLQRQGYSTDEPPKPPKEQKAKPMLSIKTLAIWGGKLAQAEITVNGRVMRVRGGEVLASGVTVDSIGRDAVNIAVTETIKARSSRKSKPALETTFKGIKVGEATEIAL